MKSGWVKKVKLDALQREMIINSLSSARNPKLRDPAVQSVIIARIEGALTYLELQTEQVETYEPFDRVSDFSISIRETLNQIERLKEYERNNFELLGCNIEKLEGDMEKAAAAAVRVVSGLKLGQGEKYGTPDENKTRFLADQLGDLWRVHLELPTGANSGFRNFLEVVCGQVGLKVLGRDALDSVLNSAGKPA